MKRKSINPGRVDWSEISEGQTFVFNNRIGPQTGLLPHLRSWRLTRRFQNRSIQAIFPAMIGTANAARLNYSKLEAHVAMSAV